MAEDALSRLGADRRRDGVRGRAHRARRARALGLLDGLRPPLRLPARRTGLVEAELQARRSSACGSSRRAARWISASPTAACRPTRWSRTSTTCSRTPNGSLLSQTTTLVQLAVAPCSPFSVTTRLMEESAALARRLGLDCTPTSPRRRGGGVLPRALRLHARRVPRARRLARRGRLVRALRPPLGARHRSASARTASVSRTARHRTCGSAPASRPCGSCSTRASESGSASTARRRTSAATCFFEVKQALLVARGRGGAGRDDRARRAAPRDARRRGVLRRDDIGSLEPGKRADIAVWRTDGLELGGRRRPRRRPRPLGPAPRRPALVGGEEVVRGGALVQRRRAGDRARAPHTGGEAVAE